MTETEKSQDSIYGATSSVLQQLGNTLDSSSTKGILASLRNSVGRELNASSEVWPLLFESINPDYLSKNGIPTAQETAMFAALQLYGIGQQGRSQSVFARGADYRLGKALGTFRKSLDDSQSFDRRFNQLVTSNSIQELLNHLRHLIKIASGPSNSQWKMDYASLAEDLFYFQVANSNQVVFRWGQSYYWQPAKQNK
ncbi:type I-E CRISPR-associated protein Cse2/CasB [Bifidobacterium aquikefiricola]|uniref:Type I-E CRISPR-associated protein Cse2/CasB n=1 Tax=Bifidobacterium aquikefiricola TaxID=3059038 RepID=A0AB39U570_9BIFI